jgi:2-(1,2-epoxy-1,2-dihydrophenyl)acetyl-CoA isomerase
VPIGYDHDGPVAEIVLRRPDKLNALTLDDVAAVSGGFTRAARNGARAILLRAEGRAFCTGRDLTTIADGEDVAASVRGYFNQLILTIRSCGVPTVAAVQGPCVGAGTGLALACDLVIAAESASFSSPFRRLGAIPDAGFHWFLTSRLGPAVVKDMVLTGRALDGREAVAAGLVARCVPDSRLLDDARALAADLAAGPTTAFRLSLVIIDDAAAGQSLAESLDAEAVGQGRAFATTDLAEGRAAFLEKREPRFSGQ